MATVTEVKSKNVISEKCHGDTERSSYYQAEAYIDTNGVYFKKKKNAPLELYMRNITAMGLNYAEAQKKETIELIRRRII